MNDGVKFEATVEDEPEMITTSIPDTAKLTSCSDLLRAAQEGGRDAVSRALGRAAQRLADQQQSELLVGGFGSYIAAAPEERVLTDSTD